MKAGASRALEQHHKFVVQQTVDSFGIAAFSEGVRFAFADDIVDPSFQRGRDAEVVDRAGNHEYVGSENFAHQFVPSDVQFARGCG